MKKIVRTQNFPAKSLLFQIQFTWDVDVNVRCNSGASLKVASWLSVSWSTIHDCSSKSSRSIFTFCKSTNPSLLLVRWSAKCMSPPSTSVGGTGSSMCNGDRRRFREFDGPGDGCRCCRYWAYGACWSTLGAKDWAWLSSLSLNWSLMVGEISEKPRIWRSWAVFVRDWSWF